MQITITTFTDGFVKNFQHKQIFLSNSKNGKTFQRTTRSIFLNKKITYKFLRSCSETEHECFDIFVVSTLLVGFLCINRTKMCKNRFRNVFSLDNKSGFAILARLMEPFILLVSK